jgi:hypothetical protein
MKLLLAIACAHLLTSCAAILTGAAITQAFELEDLKERVGINVWNDEQATSARTRYLGAPGDSENVHAYGAGIAAPAWSRDGVALRVVSRIRAGTLYQPELQVSAVSESGVQFRLYVDDVEVPCQGASRSGWLAFWHRFDLSQSEQDKARVDGLAVRIACVGVRDWTFDLAPTYFLGFEKRRAEIVRNERLIESGDHAPIEPKTP